MTQRVADLNGSGRKTHPVHQATKKTQLLAHVPARRHDLPGNNAEITGRAIVLRVSQPAQQSVKTPRGQSLQNAVSTPAAARQHYVVAFLRLGIEPGDILRAILKITVHDHYPVTLGHVQPCGNTVMLAEVSTKLQSLHPRIRNGEPLAISTPVDSIWVNPKELLLSPGKISVLAKATNRDADDLLQMITSRKDKEFVFVKRHMSPADAKKIVDLGIPGVASQREYRRFFPTGEVGAQVVGMTSIDDQGQEGLELTYNQWLQGQVGSKRVIIDSLGRPIQDVELIKEPQNGKDLVLSIDMRLQYLAYRELKAAVIEHKAKTGSAVILDVKTGEILAMVNQPSVNPNGRAIRDRDGFRNRSITDVFEPGSTIKPIAMAEALKKKLVFPETPIETAPGYLRVGRNTIRDVHNYGLLTATSVITKSSNVGIAKIVMTMEPEDLWDMYSKVGFGNITASGFSGESAGVLTDPKGWGVIEQVTLSFGYGLSVTPLQLAQAYSVFASNGMFKPVSFLKLDKSPEEKRVVPEAIARTVNMMMGTVVSKEGTAVQASIPGYQAAGKTGTVKKTSSTGGYTDKSYLAVFAGFAPLRDPRLAMVVVINEPSTGVYYGGLVAAPVFSKVMSGALRLLNVPPDPPVVQEAASPQRGDAA